MSIDEEPADGVFINNVFEFFLIITIYSGRKFFVILFGSFFPDIKRTVENRLFESVPQETGTAIAPIIILPAPESILGKIADSSIWVLGLHVVKKFKIFIGNIKAHIRVDEITRKSRRYIDKKTDEDAKKSEVVSQLRMKEGKEIKEKDGADSKENTETKHKRSGKLGEWRAEKFAEKGKAGVNKESATEEEKRTNKESAEKRFGPAKFFFEREIDAHKDNKEKNKSE